MPRLAAREISAIETTYTSDLGTFTWAWVLRVDGEVAFRLAQVDGRRERNPWRSLRSLTAAERRAIGSDRKLAAELLTWLAQERGHFTVGNPR